MKTFRAVMWNEMRVLWRRRSFWILQAVLLLPAVVIIVVSLFDSRASQFLYMVKASQAWAWCRCFTW
jgi:ABC-type Na+ efflux pump permease subunit